jgi:hypothetical protein
MQGAVRKFLLDFKQAATTGNSGIFIAPRKGVTRQTLRQLGLTKHNLEETLLGLSVVDYCKGPEQDRDQPGDVWVFGKRIKGQELYIKLKVAQVNGSYIAKCISFHPVEFPMRYPLK